MTAPPCAAEDLERPLLVLRSRASGRLRVCPVVHGVRSHLDETDADEVVALLPAMRPDHLGDPRFRARHGLSLAYVVGEMAHAIANEAVVRAAAEAGVLGFFGAAGLETPRVAEAIQSLESLATPSGRAFGVNVIHQPGDPAAEDRLVDLLIRREVRRVSASAYLGLSPSIVRLAFSGARLAADGGLVRRHVFAKVSRPEVARHFLSPPPPALLEQLVRAHQLTPEEASLAARSPVADHLTVEADSAGHTDGRPLLVLFPIIARLRDELTRLHAYPEPPLLGAAGGLGDPEAIAAAFALGAAYVLTGSINQAAVEAGTSPEVKALLAQADIADVALAPAADMFELGARVQVLKRGTMFAQRASRLGELYRAHGGLAEIPPEVTARLERDVFRAPLATIEQEVDTYFRARAPELLANARRDPKLHMALVFRWYLGQSSRWAERGERARQIDFQVWCGPAMGAFNRWAAGTGLAAPERRTIGAMAHTLMREAALATRRAHLRAVGLDDARPPDRELP